MFFDLIHRNSKRSRKENGIYFVSLIVSIVAFYIILSLKNQDVMIFLKMMESDAVNRLLALIPILYAVSLFFVFFLVFFANKYQLERRSHEFGLYLIMGMKRSRLFSLIFAENLWSSFLALLIGLSISITLSEIVSLMTSRLVGLGIIGHRFTFSVSAVFWTIIGFIGLQMVALLILSGKLAKKELLDLLRDKKEDKQRVEHFSISLIKLIIGIVFLAIAYVTAGKYLRLFSLNTVCLIFFSGIVGTFLVFRGMNALIGLAIREKSTMHFGLYTFTFRQLQENVLNRASSLAISSLLILSALICFGYGVSLAMNVNRSSEHVIDFTVQGQEELIKKTLSLAEIKPYVSNLFPMKLGSIKTQQIHDKETEKNIDVHKFSWGGLLQAVKEQDFSEEQQRLLNEFGYQSSPYLISVSSYNQLLNIKGEEPIKLAFNEVAFYSNPEFEAKNSILQKVLKSKPNIAIDNKSYTLLPNIYSDNPVADRKITIAIGIIVPDEVFDTVINQKDQPFCWNFTLPKELVEKEGLMQPMHELNMLLQGKGLEFESYLKSMGRQLFYIVAASYTTIYLAVLFLIVANTVIGLQFLMQQEKTSRRYVTLSILGSSADDMCQSARAQIAWYFTLPIGIAIVSSFFGIKAMLGSMLPLDYVDNLNSLFIMAIVTVGFLFFIECIYMIAVMKISDKHILTLNKASCRE